MNREMWIAYMLGYMISKGWRISKEDAKDFKRAFPEVSDELIGLAIKDEVEE